jgi:hypothetical protein
VEAQQAESVDKSTEKRIRLSPEAAALRRERENLRLSRQRVLDQLNASENPILRKTLEAALAELDEKLKSFGQ